MSYSFNSSNSVELDVHLERPRLRSIRECLISFLNLRELVVVCDHLLCWQFACREKLEQHGQSVRVNKCHRDLCVLA